jgi:hypothetical protein
MPRPLSRTPIPVVITYHNNMRRYGDAVIDGAVKCTINSSVSSIFVGRSIHFMQAINKTRSNTTFTRVWVRYISVDFDLKKHGICPQPFCSILFTIFIKFVIIMITSRSRRPVLSIILTCSQPAYTFSLKFSFVFAVGARGGAVVEALRYKPEGRGIDSRWRHWNFSLT